MKVRHKLTWIPAVGFIFGIIYGHEKESPVKTHFYENVLVHAVPLGILLSYIIIKIIFGG